MTLLSDWSAPDFDTERLMVRNWGPILANPGKRFVLETRLRMILTPAVLSPLPEPLQLLEGDSLSDWVTARAEESGVCVVSDAGWESIGLLLLAGPFEEPDLTLLHIGYLLHEGAWGKGYASELVLGLVRALQDGSRFRLIAGVEIGNGASVRVLEKAGFRPAEQDEDAQSLMFERDV